MAATIEAATTAIAQTTRTSELTATLAATSAQLAGTAGRTQQLASTIDAAMIQQRSTAGEVTQALVQIAESSQGMRRQTAAVAREAGDLIEVARQLRGAALRFGITTAADHPLRLLIASRETVTTRALAWHTLVDTWNSTHPDMRVALEFQPPGDEYLIELERALAAGTAADIVHVINGTELARQGALAPLDHLLTPAMTNDFYSAVLDAGRYQGRLYSLPTEAQPLLIIYNKQLFAELGVTPPRTWAEWIAVAQRCRTDRRWGIIMDTAPGNLRIRQWLPFIWQGGTDLFATANALATDSPAVRAAFQLWHDLIVTHQLVPLKLPHPFYDIANLVEGHCAMQYMGSWGLGMLHENYPNFAYGVLDLPVAPGGQPANTILRWGLGINARSPHRTAAEAFVRWVVADDSPEGVARARTLMVEGVPVRRSVIPLIEQEGAADADWRFMVDQIYPHARPSIEWSTDMTSMLEHLFDAASRDTGA